MPGLHTDRLLRNSFRPREDIRMLRTIWRLRERQVQEAAREIQHTRKALTTMNIQLANAISDLSGVTGLAIIRAILGGERDPHELHPFFYTRFMSLSDEILRYQIKSAAWANQRILSAASKLTSDELTRDFRTSEKSILGTLVHIYRAERIWLSRIEGPLLEFRVEGDDTMPALQTNWPRVSQQWIDWSETVSDERAQTELTYQDLRKNTHTQSLWKIILHVVNHATHHRGQAIGFMRALGHTPPNTDSITFALERELFSP